jgi:cytochrome b561
MHITQSAAVIEHYSATARLLHWITAVLVVAAYVVSVGGSEARVYSPANDFGRGLHELLGIGVFVLTLVRVSVRTFSPPPVHPAVSALMTLGAKVGHGAIYALLVLVPLTAILGAWFEGHPLTLLALGNIPPWLPPSQQLGTFLANIHGWLGDALIWLAGLHALAALFHHFWLRDQVLRSMLPGR